MDSNIGSYEIQKDLSYNYSMNCNGSNLSNNTEDQIEFLNLKIDFIG